MATIIDSLVVTLGLDSKDVDAKAPGVRSKLADLEKSASKTEKGVKGIGTASKGTAHELTVLSAKLGSFLAVLGGTAAVRAFVKDTIETNTQLYFLSRNLEMNTQKLFAWGAAAQEIGGSKGSIQNFMRTIAGMPGELLIGKMPQLLPLFARLGINFREPFDQIMVDLSKRFAGMDRKVAFSFGMASGIPEDVMNLILQGPGAMQGALTRTKGFGPTGKEAESAVALKRGFTDLELQIVKIGYDLLYMVTPALKKFLSTLESIGAWSQRHEKIVAVIAGVVAALTGIVALGSAVGFITIGLSALLPILTAVGAAFVAALPTLAVVGIVAALAAGIILLAQDYKVWSEGGKSLFDWGMFADGISKAKNAFEGLADKIEKATDAYGKWLKSHGLGPVMALNDKVKNAISSAIGVPVGNMETVIQIASKEGYFAQHPGFVPNDGHPGQHWSLNAHPNIPQRANNPGDILYGDFAKAHGATGYILAQGGKKIATFPDALAGWAAAYALLSTKGYSGLSPDQAISRWQTGSSLLNGVAGASRVPSSALSSSSSSSTSTDNSKVTHIGTINMSNPAGSSAMTPSMVRGMDWNTLLTQQNFGLY